jgi:hypothetical protein
MQRLYFFLSILILASLLTGCAASAHAQSEKVKALENPTSTELPEKIIPFESATPEVVSHDPPASCSVTVPQDPPFVPPDPYSPTSPFPNHFWYGTNSLWALLPTSGAWAGLPHDTHGYGQKVFWWREGYIWNEEPEPEITVTAERLDAPATPFKVVGGTNAYAGDIGSAMLTGANFSTLGCWKVTGKYKDAELSFVIWIAP